MAKKPSISSIDFHFGLGTIIPSKRPAYKNDGTAVVLKPDSSSLSDFNSVLEKELNPRLAGNIQFPSMNQIFIFIIQYFISETEYKCRDIDNMAKTVLDILKGKFYKDDGQVKTLLVSKKIDLARVHQNFAYIAIKEIKGNNEIEAIKQSGLERSVIYYQELRSHRQI